MVALLLHDRMHLDMIQQLLLAYPWTFPVLVFSVDPESYRWRMRGVKQESSDVVQCRRAPHGYSSSMLNVKGKEAWTCRMGLRMRPYQMSIHPTLMGQ